MDAEPAPAMRLDRFLWHVRIARTRPLAQAMEASGHVRLDGRAIDRAATPVRIGSVLTFAARDGQVRAVRVRALPKRRGPAPEARQCYEELDLANVSQQGPGD